MDSRLETLRAITIQLQKIVKFSKNSKLTDTLNRILRRLLESERFLLDRQDSTGKPLTAKKIGYYILKTYRMTQERSFNNILMKYMPGQYRMMAALFSRLDKLSRELLSFDYKKLRRAEADVGRIHGYLVRAENTFRGASQMAASPDKASMMQRIASEMRTITAMVYLGRNADKSVCSYRDCVERITELGNQLEAINFNDYLAGADPRLVKRLNDVKANYNVAFRYFILRKFSVHRKGSAPSRSGSRTTQEIPAQKRASRGKPAHTARMKGPTPTTAQGTSRVHTPQRRGAPQKRTGHAQQGYGRQSQTPQKSGKPQYIPLEKQQPQSRQQRQPGYQSPSNARRIPGPADQRSQGYEMKTPQRQQRSDDSYRMSGSGGHYGSGQQQKSTYSTPSPRSVYTPPNAPRERQTPRQQPSGQYRGQQRNQPPRGRETYRSGPTQQRGRPPQSKLAPTAVLRSAHRTNPLKMTPPEKASHPQQRTPLNVDQAGAEGQRPEGFFRTVNRQRPTTPQGQRAPLTRKPPSSKSFEDEVLNLLDKRRRSDITSRLPDPKTSFLDPGALQKPRSFLSEAIHKKPTAMPPGPVRPGPGQGRNPRKIEPITPPRLQNRIPSTGQHSQESYIPLQHSTTPPRSSSAPPAFDEPEESKGGGISIADIVNKSKNESKPKKMGCLPAFLGGGAAVLLLIIRLITLFVR